MGIVIYAAVFVAISTSLFVKVTREEGWEKNSVRCGMYVLKAAMIVAGTKGAAIYCCLLVQLYYFALLIDKRSEFNRSFTSMCFFMQWTMQQYFFRSSHRENFAAI